MTRALIVEDDPTTAAALAGLVRKQQWQAEVREDLASAWKSLAQSSFDFVLLDLSLPDGEGTDLLQKLRRSPAGELPDPKTPVLVISARSQLRSRLTALDLGADGYIIKPVHLEEVGAVLRALLRRRTTLAAGLITCGDVVVDPNSRFVQKAGQPVELTEQEFAVLLALLEDRPKALSRADIQARSGNRVGDGGAVEVHVHHLRRKLGEAVIQTVRGVGYRIAQDQRA
ncbi:response regulator transcription factor [Ramlibacter ginsenosidimutans]|uniref:Response regulator transcription factor n=1 Tax=Ramlibacter ginsenosidimutans TaxID=502333 RepID=A0A934TW54_9BURK|nr:response regulator transcription factor [Ramlibacter ginsenosidimutans]MBK6008005.1 response regulator transcription factor [Ramlibacter ginsenosidimutans]